MKISTMFEAYLELEIKKTNLEQQRCMDLGLGRFGIALDTDELAIQWQQCAKKAHKLKLRIRERLEEAGL